MARKKTLSQADFQIQKLTRKSKREIKRADARINIFEGAVRATKTITTRFAWLKFILSSPYNNFLQAGKTRRSLLRNVLIPQMAIMDAYGIHYDYRAGEGYINVEGKICWLLGCHNETAAEVIKGMTLAGADLDEADTYPKSVMETILDRLSLDGARAYMTMNSNSPYHYLKTGYMDNEEMIQAHDVYVSHWTLYDNPFLPRSYIEMMERRYPKGSLGWKRKIMGLWVLAEGAIYDRFVEAQHTFEVPPYKKYNYYVLSTDEGRGHAFVVGLFGIKRTKQGNHYHLLDEAYWDVTKHDGRQLTSQEIIFGSKKLEYKGALPMLKGRPLTAFFTPHDATVLRAELKQTFYGGAKVPVKSYKPNVLQDIQVIRNLIAEDRFMISNKNCRDSVDQAQSYVWDPKAQKQGKDTPLKVNDHCPDMWRGAIIGTRNLPVKGSTTPRNYKKHNYNMHDILERSKTR